MTYFDYIVSNVQVIDE